MYKGQFNERNRDQMTYYVGTNRVAPRYASRVHSTDQLYRLHGKSLQYFLPPSASLDAGESSAGRRLMTYHSTMQIHGPPRGNAHLHASSPAYSGPWLISWSWAGIIKVEVPIAMQRILSGRGLAR